MTATAGLHCPDVTPTRDSANADTSPLLRALAVGDIVSLIYRQLSWVECLSVSKALGRVAPLTVTRVPLFRPIVVRQLRRLRIDGERFLHALDMANYSLSGSFLLHCLLVPAGDPGSYSAVFTDKSDLDVFCLPSDGPNWPCQTCAQRAFSQRRAQAGGGVLVYHTPEDRSATHLSAANPFTEFLCSIGVSEAAGASAYKGLGCFASPALIAASNWDLGTVSLQIVTVNPPQRPSSLHSWLCESYDFAFCKVSYNGRTLRVRHPYSLLRRSCVLTVPPIVAEYIDGTLPDLRPKFSPRDSTVTLTLPAHAGQLPTTVGDLLALLSAFDRTSNLTAPRYRADLHRSPSFEAILKSYLLRMPKYRAKGFHVTPSRELNPTALQQLIRRTPARWHASII